MHVLQNFLDEARLCVSRGNGYGLSKLLDLTSNSNSLRHDIPQLQQELSPVPADSLVHLEGVRKLEENWREVIIGHLKVLMALDRQDLPDAFTEQAIAVQYSHSTLAIVNICRSFIRIFQGLENKALPVIFTLNEDLWTLAVGTEMEKIMEEAARIINRSFVACITDRSPMPVSRKWGTYRLAGLLFRIYFYINQLNLCNNLLKALEASELPDVERFPVAHVVPFHYYHGRYWFLNENYGKAEDGLLKALQRCHRDAIHNKRMILHFLIPTRLLRGILPQNALLNRYGMIRFYPQCISAIRRGDMKQYSALLSEYELDLLRFGTFMVFEKLIFLVYRNLFRRIFVLLERQTKIPLSWLSSSAARMASHHLDEEEAACIIANLIHKRLIKGYISQEKSFLVLSQVDPFPEVSMADLVG